MEAKVTGTWLTKKAALTKTKGRLTHGKGKEKEGKYTRAPVFHGGGTKDKTKSKLELDVFFSICITSMAVCPPTGLTRRASGVAAAEVCVLLVVVLMSDCNFLNDDTRCKFSPC